MKSEDGTGGRRPLLGDVDCHPPILFSSTLNRYLKFKNKTTPQTSYQGQYTKSTLI